MVPRRGLEPPRVAPLAPEASASTNSATWANPRRAGPSGGANNTGRVADCQRTRLQYVACSATLVPHNKEDTLKRKKTLSAKAPAARNQRGPGKRAGLPKFMPETLPPLPGKKGAKPPRIHDPHAEREASRYERPIASREAITALLEEHGELMKVEAVAHALGLTTPQDLEALTRRLAAMLRDGQLIQNRRGGYGVASKLDLIRGGVIANAEGYGFLRPDEGGDDLYLSPADMRKVLHGAGTPFTATRRACGRGGWSGAGHAG
jgi:hypothetical protein